VELRSKLLLPFVIGTVLVPVYAVTERTLGIQTRLVILVAAISLLSIGIINLLRLVCAPLTQIRSLLNKFPASIKSQSTSSTKLGDLKEIAVGTAQALQLIHDDEAKLSAEISRSQHLERSLREVEERHETMLISSNDGLWDWDIPSGRTDFSVRWQGMLGYLGHCPDGFDSWRNLIHPDDSEAVLMRLQNHVGGLTPRFDAEYRIRHHDGHYHWIHSRGTAMRHANGKAYRTLVLDNDIHQRKILERTLIEAAEGLSSVSGQEFFHALMLTLSSILNTRDNLVCYCLGDPPVRAHTLAYYTRGAFVEENFEYDLAGTSCGAVIEREEIVYCPTGVCDLWPAEKQYDRDSYLGVPMFDSNGKIIGHFACMDGGPMQHDLPHLALFKIFSVRAAAELERTLLKKKLEIT
jgi:PAS domain S-box-containing protein